MRVVITVKHCGITFYSTLLQLNNNSNQLQGKQKLASAIIIFRSIQQLRAYSDIENRLKNQLQRHLAICTTVAHILF